MESAVLRNPQSWNRYGYALNNPLRFVDPNGELWVASGDANSPYSWVDECAEGQTCHSSVSAVVGNQLRVYGSESADAIRNYSSNKSRNINLRELADDPDANFELKPGAHGYLSLKNASGFFNTAEQYGEQYPNDSALFITDAGMANGAHYPPHKTHGLGRSIDIRYFDESGDVLQGPTAATNADIDRTRTLVDIAGHNGFNQNYSARPKDFWTLFAPGHGSHLHIGTTAPVVRKIQPPKK